MPCTSDRLPVMIVLSILTPTILLLLVEKQVVPQMQHSESDPIAVKVNLTHGPTSVEEFYAKIRANHAKSGLLAGLQGALDSL